MEKEEKKKKRIWMTKTGLVCRIAVGAYLVYLSYGLTTDMMKKAAEVSRGEFAVFIAAAVLFGAVGVWFVIVSLKALRRGEYVGGEADEPRKEAAEEEKPKRITFSEEDVLDTKEE